MKTASLRTALYLRVSLDRTGEQLAVERQRNDAERVVKQRGWNIVDTYTDNSVSAAGKKERPEFTRMLDAIKRGEIQAVVAWSLDRLARNARDRLALVEACRDHGVIIALVQGSDMDPTTASGRLVIGVLGEVAEMEIGLKSERQTAAAVQRSNLGRPPLGTRLTGYTPQGDTVAQEAELVRRIFKLFHAGESLRSITRLLTNEGVTTRKGRPWNPSSIRGILTNPRYAGRAIYQGETTGRQGNWEPFVSDDVFDLVQARLADPRRKTNRVGTDRKHLGSGLYLCAACDQPTSSWSQGRYRCKDKHVNRSQSQVDQYVLDVIAERLRQPDVADLLKPATEDLAPLLVEVERLRIRLVSVESDYDAGLIDGRRFASANESIRAELAAAQQKMATSNQGATLAELLGSEDPAAEFLTAGIMRQRVVVDSLATVRLHRGTRGSRVFDPQTVQIDWAG
ncbi:recombinase family protein [Mycolicibacterium neoaurum]|uniref:Recombinase n=1 Tax=Mycolicibacterium neoaurum TaxID=1795 RepID=A0AAV2WP40_MYCNE|nr:recombinase family protein [Mycolicibacterium neoaurum]TLH57906.1 recombinase family protein [Mycolicibacterium neoaurum]CDQ45691.1 recombinase [Mycolicibacterium neoaurum]